MGIQWFTDVLHGFLFFCSWFFGLPVWRFFSITTCIPRSTHHVIYNTSSHAILTVVHSSRLLQNALAVDEQRTTQISVDYLSSLLGRVMGRTLVIISASSIKHQLSSTTIIPILLTTLFSPLPPLSQHAEPTQVSCTYGPLAPCAWFFHTCHSHFSPRAEDAKSIIQEHLLSANKLLNHPPIS